MAAPLSCSRSFRDALAGDLPSRPVSVVQGVPALLFSDVEIASLAEPFKLTLIGKVYGSPPPLSFVKHFFAALKLVGAVTIDLIKPSVFAFRFMNDLDYNRVFARRFFDLRGAIMVFSKWSPVLDLECAASIFPVWIALPGLRFHLQNASVLWSIGQLFGTPLQVDTATANRSRLASARVLVELDVSAPRPEKIWLGSSDMPSEGYFQQVDFENLPKLCVKCSSLLLKDSGCIKCVRNHIEIDGAPLAVDSSPSTPMPEADSLSDPKAVLGVPLVAVVPDSICPVVSEDVHVLHGGLEVTALGPVLAVECLDYLAGASSGVCVRGSSGTPSQPVVEIDEGVAPLPVVVSTGQSTMIEGCSAEMEVAGSHSGVMDLGAGVVDLGGVHNELEFLADVPRFDLDIDYDSAPAALALRRRKGRGKNKKYDIYSLPKSKTVNSAPRA